PPGAARRSSPSGGTTQWRRSVCSRRALLPSSCSIASTSEPHLPDDRAAQLARGIAELRGDREVIVAGHVHDVAPEPARAPPLGQLVRLAVILVGVRFTNGQEQGTGADRVE